MSKIDIGIKIDLQKLMETRMLIEADSGAGKSWAIRKTAEECSGKVQQIIIDPEGDFVTLREKYPFALVAKTGGDLPLSIRYAEALAHKILETGISVIIDLYEFQEDERERFVHSFCKALINAPKSMRNACIIYIDEAQLFCPEDKRALSTKAVIDLCTRGRKRGLCPILATLRISILNKSAAAQCKNKLMGSTSLPLDQKRVGDELGLRTKEEILNLRNLDAGEFHAFGPAISKEIIKFKVGKVKTTHVGSGVKLTSLPPTPAAIKKILSKLEAIPEEAEKELNTKNELQAEIKRLKAELKQKPVPVAAKTIAPYQDDQRLKQQISLLQAQLKEEQRLQGLWKKLATGRGTFIEKLSKQISELPNIKIEPQKIVQAQVIIPVHKKDSPVATQLRTSGYPPINDKKTNGVVTGGAMRMLKAAAMFAPEPITKTRMAALARLSHTSGSFSTYMSTLKREGLLHGDGNLFTITDNGLVQAGDVEPLPTDPEQLVNLWCGVIGENGGAARILRALADAYPNEISKIQLGDDVGMSSTSGSFSTYLSTLKRNGLITTSGQNVKASNELFE